MCRNSYNRITAIPLTNNSSYSEIKRLKNGCFLLCNTNIIIYFNNMRKYINYSS